MNQTETTQPPQVGGSELNVELDVAIPDGYLLIPKEPSIELLEKFVGRGLMCGTTPHPEVYADALRRYQRFIGFLTHNATVRGWPDTDAERSCDASGRRVE